MNVFSIVGKIKEVRRKKYDNGPQTIRLVLETENKKPEDDVFQVICFDSTGKLHEKMQVNGYAAIRGHMLGTSVQRGDVELIADNIEILQ